MSPIFTAFNRPCRIQDARGNWTILRYDAKGNLTDTIKTVASYSPGVCGGECAFPAANQVVAWTVNGLRRRRQSLEHQARQRLRRAARQRHRPDPQLHLRVLLGISKKSDRYLRTLLIHGARSALRTAEDKNDAMLVWALKLKQAKGFNVAAVALANKMARIAWALLAHELRYQAQWVA